MIELRGKHNTCKVFTDNIDNATVGQLIALMNQSSVAGSQIRIMPDTHAGKGCVIGTTMTISNKVIPNLVGVDIGCIDSETEILTTCGWIYIKDYKNQDILVYDKDTDTAFFDTPNAFIVKNADMWFHLKNKYGLDQMVSPEHKVLVWKGTKSRGYKLVDYRADELVEKHESLARGIAGGIKTTFNLYNDGINMSDDCIRLNIMISADGCIRRSGNIEMHFKKERKIQRCIKLLEAVNISYKVGQNKDGSTEIYFKDTGFNKSLAQFWSANQHQLKIICEECMFWDGTVEDDRMCYYTCNKENADLIQYAFACNGVRCGISKQIGTKWGENWNDWYSVYTTKNQIVGLPDYRYTAHIDRIQPKDDEKKYCFNTNTGYFIIRRNNKISITGNCGMAVAELKETRIDLPKLDSVINKKVPSGFSVRDKVHKFLRNVDIEELYCYKNINVDRAEKSLGTLGGGNHFIEVDTSENGQLYLVVHTGSRNLGKQVAEYYQDLAWKSLKNGNKGELIKAKIDELKAAGRQSEIEAEIAKIQSTVESVPKKLAYCEGELFDKYIHDMKITQEYAYWNREAILDTIVDEMHLHVIDQCQTIHNYIDTENMILRKGSVSAQAGEKLIIPINMRDGSLICTGKGNPDWNYSAPHGAGRLMSRSEAKQNITLSEFKKTMKEAGIYSTSVNKSTIDESPMAYKPMQEIIDNIQDTVDIVNIIKPIYNFKAGEE